MFGKLAKKIEKVSEMLDALYGIEDKLDTIIEDGIEVKIVQLPIDDFYRMDLAAMKISESIDNLKE